MEQKRAVLVGGLFVITCLISVLSFEARADTWRKCAQENGTCKNTQNHLRWLRYGIDDKWLTVPIGPRAQIACKNAVFKTDPAVGKHKICELGDKIQLASGKWQTCARENEKCRIKVTGDQVLVRYGSMSKKRFLYRVMPKGTDFACSNAYFGNDPIVGTAKSCDFAYLKARKASSSQKAAIKKKLPEDNFDPIRHLLSSMPSDVQGFLRPLSNLVEIQQGELLPPEGNFVFRIKGLVNHASFSEKHPLGRVLWQVVSMAEMIGIRSELPIEIRLLKANQRLKLTFALKIAESWYKTPTHLIPVVESRFAFKDYTMEVNLIKGAGPQTVSLEGVGNAYVKPTKFDPWINAKPRAVVQSNGRVGFGLALSGACRGEPNKNTDPKTYCTRDWQVLGLKGMALRAKGGMFKILFKGNKPSAFSVALIDAKAGPRGVRMNGGLFVDTGGNPGFGLKLETAVKPSLIDVVSLLPFLKAPPFFQFPKAISKLPNGGRLPMSNKVGLTLAPTAISVGDLHVKRPTFRLHSDTGNAPFKFTVDVNMQAKGNETGIMALAQGDLKKAAKNSVRGYALFTANPGQIQKTVINGVNQVPILGPVVGKIVGSFQFKGVEGRIDLTGGNPKGQSVARFSVIGRDYAPAVPVEFLYRPDMVAPFMVEQIKYIAADHLGIFLKGLDFAARQIAKGATIAAEEVYKGLKTAVAGIGTGVKVVGGTAKSGYCSVKLWSDKSCDGPPPPSPQQIELDELKQSLPAWLLDPDAYRRLVKNTSMSEYDTYKHAMQNFGDLPNSVPWLFDWQWYLGAHPNLNEIISKRAKKDAHRIRYPRSTSNAVKNKRRKAAEQGIRKTSAIMHWRNHGFKQGSPGSKGFQAAYYLYKHKDVAGQGQYNGLDGAIRHYQKFGRRENRQTAPALHKANSKLMFWHVLLPCRALVGKRVLVGSWRHGQGSMQCEIGVNGGVLRTSAFDTATGQASLTANQKGYEKNRAHIASNGLAMLSAAYDKSGKGVYVCMAKGKTVKWGMNGYLFGYQDKAGKCVLPNPGGQVAGTDNKWFFVKGGNWIVP